MEARERYHELCRLCASYDAVKMDIFGREGKNRQLVDKIQTCLPFKITENDRLPKCLCYRCMYNLENFYDFRTACVNAVALLERCLPSSEVIGDTTMESSVQRRKLNSELLKEKESMPILIPEAPIVNPNAALGTPPRLNSDGEADNEIEGILDNSSTDEATVVDDSEDRKSDEYEMDMETNPSDFLEMTPMVTEDNEVLDSKNASANARESTTPQLPVKHHEVYVCSLCNKAFSSKGHLSLHARIHVGAGDVIGEKVITDDHTSYKRPYQCDLCNKSYSTAKHRWGHVSTTHRGHPAVTCGYCSRIYSTRTNLEEHIKSRHAGLPAPQELSAPIVHSDNRHQCKHCQKLFGSVMDLSTHNRVCIGHQKPQFLENNELQIDKDLIDTSDISSIDTDEDNKIYKNAEAKLAKNPQLTILKQALTKGDSLKRDFEDKSRTNCKLLKVANTDSCETDAQKRWYCESCPHCFTSVDDLKEHEQTHDTDKPFICILCNKDFVLKSSLSRHILTSHGVDPSPFADSDKCLKKSVVTQTWNEQKQVSVYEQKSTPTSLKVPIPSEVNLQHVDNPEVNHENMIEVETVFVCEICTRDFNDRASLWLHIRATHKEFAAFACGVCLKICSDNAQLLNHVNMYHGGSKLLISEQRRYSCTICGRQHDSRKKLIAHVSIHNIDPAYDPANFVQLNTNYYTENVNENDGNDHTVDYDVEDGDKIDCYICYKSFPNEDHLIRHQRNAHKAEQMVSIGESCENGNTANMNGNCNRAQYHLFFVCELCGSSHPSKWERWLHVSGLHSNEPTIKCEREDCGKIFATKSLRNEHIQHHLIQGASPNTCEICGKLWGSRVDYWKHVMGVHSDTVPLICGVCLKVFPDVLELSAHVKAKHWPLTNGDFSCDICGRPYSNKSKMSRHRKIHGLEGDDYDISCINETTNESFKVDHTTATEVGLNCELCADMKFPRLEDLCNHRRMVHGLFPCDLCNKCYGRTSHLWKHVNRVHKGHVDITCPYCLKTSASKDHLAAHIAKIHRYEPEVRRESQNCVNMKTVPMEDGALHYCEKCNKGFHKRYLLRRHMKGCQNYRKDPGALLTRCRACERIFKDRASLQKHIENHHSTYTCHLCNETITSKLGIMTHNRVKHMDHPDLTCEYSSCKKLFRTKEDLESHKKDHKYHSNPNVCDFCGDTVENKLKLKMHVLSLHRNEIGVSCGVCLIPMKDPKDLKKHVEDVHESVLSKPNTCQVCGKQYASKWKAFDHTKKCHGKVFRTCKQCLAVFTNDIDIRDHYEHVHNVPKDQLIAFEYRMDARSKADDYDTPDVIVKEEPDELEFDEDLCDDDSNESKRRRSLSDTFDCEMCPEIFLNYETLSKHYQNVHNTDPVRMFKKRKQDGSSTKRKMRNRKNFECENCKKQFCTKTLFWNHINICTRRGASNRLNIPNMIPTSILESRLKNNNQIDKEQSVPHMTESNLNIPDFNLFEDINMQLSNQKPVPNLMPLSQIKPPPNIKCSRKDSRKVYDESTNTECACEVCGKQWPAKKHLWQHLIRFHRAEAAVTCGVCLKLCKTYEDLADHLKAFHAAILSSEGNNFTCKTCGRYHNARSKLLLHMSIHINYVGSFWCPKCQQNLGTESKLTDHIVSCNAKSEFEDHSAESALKNDVDEKGSLIGDEMSIAGEVEEVDFESEVEEQANIHDDTNSENTENTEESESANNSASSSGDEDDEDDVDEEDDNDGDDDNDEDDEEVGNDSESESRSNSGATGEVTCNSDTDNSDLDNIGEVGHDVENKVTGTINCFRIHKDETAVSFTEEHYLEKEKMIIQEQEDSDNTHNLVLQAQEVPSEDIEDTDQLCNVDVKESNIPRKNDIHFSDNDDEDNEEEEQEEEDDDDGDDDDDHDEHDDHDDDEEGDDDDDGPPILSPIMPLLLEHESEDQNSMDHMRHKLSPMIPLSIDTDKDLDMCELSEMENVAEQVNASSNSNSAHFYNNSIANETLNVNTSSAMQSLNFVSEDFGNGKAENEISESGNEDEHDVAMMDENDECHSINRFQKLESTEDMEDYEEVSFEENLNDEMEVVSVSKNSEVQIHNLDGTVLMLTNDSDGNQILIQQNVLAIRNEDSSTGATEYIYEESNEYDMDEYDISPSESGHMIQSDGMPDTSLVQDDLERNDSTEKCNEKCINVLNESVCAKNEETRT